MVFTVFHLDVCIIHEQIVHEFNCIMGKPIATEINEIWGEMAAQIIQLAKQEVDNHWIQDILADQPEELSEGACMGVDTCTYMHVVQIRELIGIL